MLRVVQADSTSELDGVRSLFRAFVAWHRERHVADIHLIDRYFDAREFESELAGLPGKYAPPQGSLRLALMAEQPVGCVAMRDLGQGVCEMKRMFVPNEFRGQGVGAKLAGSIIADAQAAGYRTMRLDTSKHQHEAMKLYENFGFVRTQPYYELADDLRDWLIFFERPL